MSKIKIVALIDGDVLLHRVGSAVQSHEYKFVIRDGKGVVYFQNEGLKQIKDHVRNLVKDGEGKLVKTTKAEPFAHAAHILKASIKKILRETLTENYYLFLSPTDRSNFRFDVANTIGYKHNRKSAKPIHYEALREYMIKSFNTKIAVGQEADDSLGIAATYLNKKGDMAIICTNDKDLDQIAGHHYNIVLEGMYETTEQGRLDLENRKKLTGSGLMWFYAQTLMGDSGDGVPGLPGCGPAGAYDLLEKATCEEELLEITAKAYCSKLGKAEGITKLFEMADLVWIRRYKNEYKSQDIKRRLRQRAPRVYIDRGT